MARLMLRILRSGGGLPAVAMCGVLAACSQAQRLQDGRPTTSAGYGASAAASGLASVVGAALEDGMAREEGAVYTYVATGDTWALDARLKAPDAGGGDHFGAAVAFSDFGETLAVGAPFATANGVSGAGAVYIFQRVVGGWSQQAKLVSPIAQAGEGFGSSVALDDDRLVVGSFGNLSAGPPTGAAYVFQREASVWGAPVALSWPSPAAGDAFGASVAVSGDAVFVGAPGKSKTGVVYQYASNDSGWTLVDTLEANDQEVAGGFGSALAVWFDGTATRRLLVGAPETTREGTLFFAGAAYVFTSSSGGPFGQPQTLVASDAATFDGFGGAVTIEENDVLIGAPGIFFGTQAGAAYAFGFDGTRWSQTAKLAATPNAGDRLGSSVAILGEHGLVGAPGEALEPALMGAGTVHAYRQTSAGNWVAGYRLAASEGTAFDGFGTVLAMSGDTLAVGAYGGVDLLRRDPDGWSLTQKITVPSDSQVIAVATDGVRMALFREPVGNNDDTGVVDVYVRSTAGVWTFETELTPDLTSDYEQGTVLSLGLALEDSWLVLGVPRWNDGKGRVFVYSRSMTTWTEAQLLVSSSDEFDRNFGERVALHGDTLVITECPGSMLAKTMPFGQVHVYAATNGQFVAGQSFAAPTPADLDKFGLGLALGNDLLAVSDLAGTLRLYRRTAGTFNSTWSTSLADVNLNQLAMAFDGDLLALGAVHASSDAGEVRIYQRQPKDAWTLLTSWTPWDHAAGNEFGHTIGFDSGHLVSSNATTPSGDVYSTEF